MWSVCTRNLGMKTKTKMEVDTGKWGMKGGGSRLTYRKDPPSLLSMKEFSPEPLEEEQPNGMLSCCNAGLILAVAVEVSWSLQYK